MDLVKDEMKISLRPNVPKDDLPAVAAMHSSRPHHRYPTYTIAGCAHTLLLSLPLALAVSWMPYLLTLSTPLPAPTHTIIDRMNMLLLSLLLVLVAISRMPPSHILAS